MDDTVRVSDAKTGIPLLTYKAHRSDVTCVAFSPDGKTIASGSFDNILNLSDAQTGDSLRMLEHTGYVKSVAFSPNGRILASGSGDRTVRLWDVRSGMLISTLKGHANTVSGVAFSPDGRTLASACWGGTVLLWELPFATVE